jgi:hypothetical protein
MTHDELLMLVTGGTNYTMAAEHLLYRKALRAVVELHKPDVRGNCDICSWIIGKPGYVVYEVCPTIQAIEKELK